MRKAPDGIKPLDQLKRLVYFFPTHTHFYNAFPLTFQVHLKMYFPILTILPILSFISFTSAFATDNTTADIDPRTFRNNWGKQKCALVKGRIGIYKFDFGCLCSGTVDSYAKNNKFDNNLKNLVSDIVSIESFPPLLAVEHLLTVD